MLCYLARTLTQEPANSWRKFRVLLSLHFSLRCRILNNLRLPSESLHRTLSLPKSTWSAASSLLNRFARGAGLSVSMVPRILILLQDFSRSSGKLLSRTWDPPLKRARASCPHRGFLYSRKLGKWITYRPSCAPLVVLLAQSQLYPSTSQRVACEHLGSCYHRKREVIR